MHSVTPSAILFAVFTLVAISFATNSFHLTTKHGHGLIRTSALSIIYQRSS
jgi:hypothetical protein